jgi:hypothetical protein
VTDLPNGWIRTKEQHAPLYQDVLVLCQGGTVSVGSYLGHGTYTHQRYPVLGQCKATHWQPLPELPNESAR